jgi:maltose-binding protein MalE
LNYYIKGQSLRKRNLVAAAVLAATSLLLSGIVAAPATASDKLIIWADDERGKQLKPVLDGKVYGGKTVEIVTYTSKTTLDTAFQAATAANGPDILFGPVGESVTAAKNGKALPFVLSAASAANLPKAAVQYGQYKGRQYGLPLDIDSVSMIWNTKFGKAPTSLAEFSTRFAAAKKAKKANYGACTSDGSWNSLSFISALGGYSVGVNAAGVPNPKDVGVNNPTFISNLKKYALGANGKSNGLLKVDFWETCSVDWLAGKAMAVVTGSWRIPATDAAKIKYTIQPFPTVSGVGNSKTVAGWGGAYITSFAKTNKKESAAKAFMNFMATPAGSTLYAATVQRPSPNSKVAANQSKILKAFAQSMAKTAVPQYNNLYDNKAGGANYFEVLQDAWNKVLIKGQNPKTVWDKAAAVLKKNFAAGAKN